MSLVNRRESFKLFLSGLLGAAGSVVLASSALSPAPTDEPRTDAEDSGKDLAERADRVAEVHGDPEEGQEELCSFVNGRFRNVGGGGGFRNGAFRNGGFVNGGFRNGGFRNGAFVNGGFRNGAFRNF